MSGIKNVKVGKEGGFWDQRNAAEAELEQTRAEILAGVKRGKDGCAVLDLAFISAMEMLITEGNTRANAARVIGIQRTKLASWLSKGREDINSDVVSLYSLLVWAVDKCEGLQERILVKAAMKAATHPHSDGTLALKILERRNAEEWAPALPEIQDGTSAFSSMSRQALNEEAKRILAAASKPEETIVEATLVKSNEND
jgi:hypothetical protein